MQLEVLSDYQAGEHRWTAGEVITVPELLGDHLLRDSPGSFRRVDDGEASAPPPGGLTRPAPPGRKRGGSA